MARTVRDASLESRAARSKLKARGKPYYRAIDQGLHLGYRKLAGKAGRWVLRLYEGRPESGSGSPYVTEVIAGADDVSDPTFSNGDIATAKIKDTDILSFTQAQAVARRMRDERSRGSAGIKGPYTVSRALEDYFTFLRSEGRPDHLV